MFGDNQEKKKEAAKGEVETILGSGTNIEGDIYTKGSIRVEGEITGNIKADGDLFVGEDGVVNTEVKARNIIVAGKVEGNVIAKNKLEILPTGRLYGDIKTKTIKIEEGAVFKGSSTPLADSNKKKKKAKSTAKKTDKTKKSSSKKNKKDKN